MLKQSVFIAMQDRISREVLITWFNQQGWYPINATGDELTLVQNLVRDKPTLTILDSNITSSPALRSFLRNHNCYTSFFVYTKCCNCEAILKALRFNITALLSCEAGLTEIQEAVQAWERHERYICPTLYSYLRMNDLSITPDDLFQYAQLTKQERHVLTLVGKCLTNQQIADQLYRSIETVHNHRKNIRRKLGLTGHESSLIRYALSIHRSLLTTKSLLT